MVSFRSLLTTIGKPIVVGLFPLYIMSLLTLGRTSGGALAHTQVREGRRRFEGGEGGKGGGKN